MKTIGNMVGTYSPIGKTFIIEDEHGNQLTGVVTEQEQIFTATDNDVREGMVYAGDAGVSTGSKNIPAYHSTEGRRIVTNGSQFVLSTPDYDFTKLQSMICLFNTNLDNSVAVEKVVINDSVYNIQSTTALSKIIKDDTNSRIDFGITNTSGNMCVIRYFMYKEIY